MAQQVKAFAAKPNVSSIPRPYMAERDNHLLGVVVRPPHIHHVSPLVNK